MDISFFFTIVGAHVHTSFMICALFELVYIEGEASPLTDLWKNHVANCIFHESGELFKILILTVF
jgi:hypothetical protein